MWEVFSCGQIPFSGIPNIILAKDVCEGVRLGPPRETPARLYSLWLRMWEPDASARPSIASVRVELEDILANKDFISVDVSLAGCTCLFMSVVLFVFVHVCS